MNADDLVALNEEIAGLARAGLPLDQGLAAMAREMGRGQLRQVTADLAEDLRAGHTLPQALERQKDRLPPYYAGLITAGIRVGRVHDVLASLSLYARSLLIIRRIIVDALIYPAIVTTFALVLFGIMFYFIMPQFEKIYADFKLKLPLLTEVLIVLGRHHMVIFVIPLAVLIVGVVVLRFVLKSTTRGRVLWTRLVYSLPLIGVLVRSARLAAFADLLAILVDHEVPLPEAFQLAGQATSDPLVCQQVERVMAKLNLGVPLGEALKGRGLVPEWVSWMTGVGERKGTLGDTLHHIGEMYRREVEMRAAVLRNVLPPVLIIATAAVFVLFFVLAMMLPLVRLIEGLSGAKV